MSTEATSARLSRVAGPSRGPAGGEREARRRRSRAQAGPCLGSVHPNTARLCSTTGTISCRSSRWRCCNRRSSTPRRRPTRAQGRLLRTGRPRGQAASPTRRPRPAARRTAARARQRRRSGAGPQRTASGTRATLSGAAKVRRPLLLLIARPSSPLSLARTPGLTLVLHSPPCPLPPPCRPRPARPHSLLSTRPPEPPQAQPQPEPDLRVHEVRPARLACVSLLLVLSS